ncbi:MAG TPA: hypothetical protein DCR43_01265 [Bacteroidales bacterium]|nr:MAG: hypothetical protein A2X11_15090 [Bacteroidetes bacterium GWE2_42_24]OFY31669.1 MAG: hypothetical protein A2X09_08835 [Bacteroidetes bacterium GWF2_43_11]PKP20558.1 MAG: hypothetical protein CVU06_10520 [Bacteroidetes bacterium HGW-Bacteroidetes-22]HAQ64480.1 hypothetical protein [Bacteroidales bacterium]HBZ67067.1 hypothetical protein [Bacteroidales bacterium]
MKQTLWSLPVLILALTSLTGCVRKPENWKEVDLSKYPRPEVFIQRYELDLFNIPQNELVQGLKTLAPKYPLFIGNSYNSEQALIQMRDYLSDQTIIEGYEAVEKTFNDLTACEKALGIAFQRIQAVIPEFRIPQVFSYISGYDTETGIFVNDSVVIIPLDQFLGDGFPGYQKLGIPAYVQRNMTPEHIVPEVVKQILNFHFWFDTSQRPLIDQMVEAGKHQTLMELVLPTYPAAQLIGYTPDQYLWCEQNEANIWAMMIEKQMLFSSDPANIRAMMNDGPFTPGLDKASPGRIGEWMGSQIVKSYLRKHPDTHPAQLFKLPQGQDFLQESSYKPKS